MDNNNNSVCPTSFPNPNALGASFNRTMFREIGRIIGVELRSLWLQGATEASTWSGRPHAGLDCWAPNININRDPRWGRNQEVASEDPYYNGVFGTEYTLGLQTSKDDERYLQVVVTLKHWDAYSLEDVPSKNITRHNFNAIVSNFTLADTYWPAFKASVMDGKAAGVMCSYNALNGVPTCANPLLNHVLRNVWGFDGYMTSDTGAISDIYKEHHYTKDGKGATCAALKDGGCDMNSGSVYASNLLDVVADPTLSCDMEDVKIALRRTLGLRFRLGLFDPIADQPLWNVSKSSVGSVAHSDTNKLATRESMVLLQNQNQHGLGLPFEMGKSVVVIGPHANASAALVGNYLGQICPGSHVSDLSCVETPVEAITRLNQAAGGGSGSVTSSLGCNIDSPIKGGVEEAVALAKNADYIVLMLGISQSIEGESHDRVTIDLPSDQHVLAQAVLALGKPAVVVLVNGGMVGIEEEKKLAPSILETFYPGFWGADAIAATIFGQNENLGGKLPITIYHKDYVDEVEMDDMSFAPHGKSPGRSYRYYTGNATFPAFTGMSLTTFDVAPTAPSVNFTSSAVFRIEDDASKDDVLQTYSMRVTNSGSRTGDEVVFMFASGGIQSISSPKRRLAGFERVHLLPGETKIIQFQVTVDVFKSTDPANGDVVVVPGDYRLLFATGGESSDVSGVLRARVESSDRVMLAAFPSL